MNKCAIVSFGLLLSAGFCFAKQNAVSAGPFQFGNVLTPLATVSLKTAEISAFMPGKNVLFVVGGDKVVEVVDLSNPGLPKKVAETQVPGNASSVTVHGDLVAVSLLEDEEWRDGQVQVMRYTDSLETIGVYKVCSQPDMLTFTPDGKKLLVACEGSPSADFAEDPEGGVAILSVKNAGKAELWKKAELTVARFNRLDTAGLKKAGVRAPGAQGFVKSLEPEYITVSGDSRWAWVSLQENNAIAKLDVAAKKIVKVFPLGYIDHSQPGSMLDAVSDGMIEMKNYPLRGLRQPDGIASFAIGDKYYVLTANEGAPVNDYKAWTDVTTPLMLAEQGRLDRSVFTDSLLNELKDLSVSNLERCNAGKRTHASDNCPYMYAFGSRSVSIFDGEKGALVWDSHEMFERILAKIAPEYFNWNSKKNKVKMDKRSSDKGCEPENVTVGEVGYKRYAFVGLERTSGIAVVDVTDIEQGNLLKVRSPEDYRGPKVVDYYLDPLDRGPEGILFIPADKSPLADQALLVVGYEYSKTLTIYQVK